VLTSSLQLARSFQVETESNALDTLVLAPVSPPALFYGKALSNTLQLFGVGLVSLPAVIALYDVEVKEPAGLLLLTLILGALGLAAPGTLYAGLTARLAARQLMLPLLLFPLVVPCLLAAVKATTLILQGDPMDQIGSWLTLLACFDALYWSLCGVLFGKVIDA
jgi:heme exporter protein B